MVAISRVGGKPTGPRASSSSSGSSSSNGAARSGFAAAHSTTHGSSTPSSGTGSGCDVTCYPLARGDDEDDEAERTHPGRPLRHDHLLPPAARLAARRVAVRSPRRHARRRAYGVRGAAGARQAAASPTGECMTDDPTRPISPATRAWWSYERAAAYDVVGTTIDGPGARRDHDRLRAAPPRATVACRSEGRFPSVVVEFTPYVVLRDFYLGEADFFTARGYNALVPVLRGVGDSGGTVGPRQLPASGSRRARPDRVARRAAVLRRPHRDVRRELRRPDQLQRGGRASRAPRRDRADAVAVVALPRRGVPRWHQVDRARRDRQLARHRQPDHRRRGRCRRGVRREPRAPDLRRVLARPVVRRVPRGPLDPGPRDRRLEGRLLPVRHPREHRGRAPAYLGGVRTVGALLPGRARRRAGVVDQRHGRRAGARAGRDPADAVRRPAGVVRPLGGGAARRPGPAGADVHVVRGPGRDRRRMARARSLGPDRECGRRAPSRR